MLRNKNLLNWLLGTSKIHRSQQADWCVAINIRLVCKFLNAKPRRIVHQEDPQLIIETIGNKIHGIKLHGSVRGTGLGYNNFTWAQCYYDKIVYRRIAGPGIILIMQDVNKHNLTIQINENLRVSVIYGKHQLIYTLPRYVGVISVQQTYNVCLYKTHEIRLDGLFSCDENVLWENVIILLRMLEIPI